MYLKAELVDAQTASSIIAIKDDYILNFSEFDLQSRLGTSAKVMENDLVKFLSRQTVDWTNSEEEMLHRIFDELTTTYMQYNKYLFDSVKFIKTTGREECDAAYTRGKYIYIPISMFKNICIMMNNSCLKFNLISNIFKYKLW